MSDLASLRSAIDDIDAQLLRLLNDRAKLSLSVGKLKANKSEAVLRPDREYAILEKLVDMSQGGSLPPEHIRAIWREIFSSSRSLQRPHHIAFLGPEGTHSHSAALAYFGHVMHFQPCLSFREVFSKVSNGTCDFGVIPLENVLHGTVGQCFDLFMEYEIFIQAEFIHRIRHCLLSLAPDLVAVRVVRSHPQALAQCEQWLHQHIPNATLMPAESTAQAAQICVKDTTSASIGNENLSTMLSLPILANNIEDEADNQTRFVVIGLTPPKKESYLRSSILFTTPDYPGALASILNLLSRASINMRKLESRPSHVEHWNYAFFADVDVNFAAPQYVPVFQAISVVCRSLRLLGSYPSGLNTIL